MLFIAAVAVTARCKIFCRCCSPLPCGFSIYSHCHCLSRDSSHQSRHCFYRCCRR